MKIGKVVLSLVGLVIILIVGLFGYAVATYIDDRVAEGSGYGFEIGQTKAQAAASIRSTYQDQQLFVRKTVNGEMVGPKEPLSLPSSGLGPFENRDEWEFYLDNDSINFLRLRFTEGRLVEIWRHRQKFELP